MTYPTDLTDEQYERIDKFLPDYKGYCRPRIYGRVEKRKKKEAKKIKIL